MKQKINSLYVHIPFCRNICSYCDFFKILKNKTFEDKYINELVKDLKEVQNKFLLFKTIYIGGGTPSCLEFNNLEKILKVLSKMHLNKYEFTIECNPEDINDEFLKLITKYGVNRVSIGIQTFNQSSLARLNRQSNIDFKEAINRTKKYISNINVDFIYGLPNENLNDIKNNLDTFLELDVNHVSLYSLTISKNTLFYNQKIKEIREDDSRIYYDYISSILNKNGFKCYEVSNFAKKGFESKHNLNYWLDNFYLGIGAGAHGYINNVRYKVSSNLLLYLNGERKIEEEVIDEKLHKEEFIMLGLRLKKGLSLIKYESIFKVNFLEEFSKIIDILVKEKLIKIDKNYLKCTKNGFIIQDQIIVKFFEYI